MSSILFFYEDTGYKLKKKTILRKWVIEVIKSYNFELAGLNYIFCSDSFLLDLNQQYLNHDTYTDIITFDNSETPGMVEADIYISIDRVIENAEDRKSLVDSELHRVMIHGTLHLLGLKDKSSDEKRVMREREDACLSLLKI